MTREQSVRRTQLVSAEVYQIILILFLYHCCENVRQRESSLIYLRNYFD